MPKTTFFAQAIGRGQVVSDKMVNITYEICGTEKIKVLSNKIITYLFEATLNSYES